MIEIQKSYESKLFEMLKLTDKQSNENLSI